MTRRRVRLRHVLIPAGFFVVAWTAYAALTLLDARSEALDGLDLIERAQDRAEGVADLLEDDDLLADLAAARDRFAAAHDQTGNPLLAPARILPVVGRQVRSVDALAGSAEHLADVASDVLNDARELVEEPPTTPQQRLDVVRTLRRLTAEARAELEDVDLGPSEGLLGPLARARNRFATELVDARRLASDASELTEALRDLLEGPRRYLVFAANPAEMRAGSGMFLIAGELTVADGALDLGDMRTVGDFPVPEGAVALTGDFADRWGFLRPDVEFRNLMLSPRFPVSAALATDMWGAAGNARPDGVLAVDPVALQQIVGATGPVEVDGRTFDADGLAQYLLHGQYREFPERSERQDLLGEIAEVAFDRLNEGGWEVSDVAQALADAVRGRHLMLWSEHEAEREGWEAASADGSLDPDSLLVSVVNRGGNKLDPFFPVDARLEIAEGDDVTEAVVRVEVRHEAPEGLPQRIAGPDPRFGLPPGTHRAILAVSLPGAARNGRIDGVDELAVVGGDGPTRVVGTQFEFTRGQTREFVVRFELPPEVESMQVEPSARRPPIDWRFRDNSWQDARTRRVRW